MNENDLNKQCGYLKEADNCLKNFISRCTTPIQRQMVAFMGEGSNDLLDDYCKPGTELRKAYLKHATCLNSAQKSHQKSCIKDLQVSLEALTSINTENWQKRIPIGCCSYKRFEHCIGSQVEKKCGKEALDFINLVLKRAFSRMPDMVCRNYKPEKGDCASILPPVGSTPKGKPSIPLQNRNTAKLSLFICLIQSQYIQNFSSQFRLQVYFRRVETFVSLHEYLM